AVPLTPVRFSPANPPLPGDPPLHDLALFLRPRPGPARAGPCRHSYRGRAAVVPASVPALLLVSRVRAHPVDARSIAPATHRPVFGPGRVFVPDSPGRQCAVPVITPVKTATPIPIPPRGLVRPANAVILAIALLCAIAFMAAGFVGRAGLYRNGPAALGI